MSALGLIGVSFDGVMRSSGGGALQRSAYQMGMEYGSSNGKVRGGGPVQHLRQWLLLPDSVEPSIWTRKRIWTAAAAAEVRKDAREGRTFDMGWPRELPLELMDAAVAQLYRPFLEMGLPIQVDAERSMAADGKPNDHLHGLIATRVLTNEGFAPTKCRQVDTWFLAGVRGHVANTFNDVAQASGLQVTFDPRPNAEREDGLPPEDYLPRSHTRTATYESVVAQRTADRRLRHEFKDLSAQISSLRREEAKIRAEIRSQIAGLTVLTATQATSTKEPITAEEMAAALVSLDASVEAPFVVPGIGTAVVVESTLVLDTGYRILIDEPLQKEAVEAAITLAQRKGWGRDLGLMDSFGMPLPVPKYEAPLNLRDVQGTEGRLRGDVLTAARWIAGEVDIENHDRRGLQERVLRRDDPALNRLVGRLSSLASGDDTPATETTEDVLRSALGELDLWPRYRLEQDLSYLLVPGHALSRPFKVPSGFAESYQYGEFN